MAMSDAKKKELKSRRAAPLVTPSDLGAEASADIAGGMNAILADVLFVAGIPNRQTDRAHA